MLRRRHLDHARDVRRRQTVLGAQAPRRSPPRSMSIQMRQSERCDSSHRPGRSTSSKERSPRLARGPARKPATTAFHARRRPPPSSTDRSTGLPSRSAGAISGSLRAHRQPPLEETRHPLGQGEPLRQKHVRPQRALHPKDPLRLHEIRVAVHHDTLFQTDPRSPPDPARRQDHARIPPQAPLAHPNRNGPSERNPGSARASRPKGADPGRPDANDPRPRTAAAPRRGGRDAVGSGPSRGGGCVRVRPPLNAARPSRDDPP